MKRLVLISLLFLFNVSVFAQLSTNERPVGFDLSLKKIRSTKSATVTATLPVLDMKKIEREDIEDEEKDVPPRFGYLHKVNYNLNNSGTWMELPNGDKLWQLNVICPEALSINFLYDKFWIPEGGKFFIYSADHKHSIGAFTSINNKGDQNNVRGFATGLVYGSDVVLEYYQPKDVTSEAIISIEYVVHGYRYIRINERSLGDSESCQVNINCSEGKDWQNEKRAVALILVNGNRFCTGSLVNTTDLSQIPYLLTANHCLEIDDYTEFDAIESPLLDCYSFYWNYEAPGCDDISDEPVFFSTSGAKVVANDHVSDYALLQLSEDPKLIDGFDPFYLGWDNSGLSGAPGVCIHHPSGDVKKISYVASQPIATSYVGMSENVNGLYWRVTWAATQNGHGTTEHGSSGSPLLNSEHRFIGQLFGGFSGCDAKTDPDWYGRFKYAWTGLATNSIFRRVDYWLDPINSGKQSMNGLMLISESKVIQQNGELYSNILVSNSGQLVISGNLQFMGSRIIVASGGKLVINGGHITDVDIVLESGSTLRIDNGGVIETNEGFNAPSGSILEIEHGAIL